MYDQTIGQEFRHACSFFDTSKNLKLLNNPMDPLRSRQTMTPMSTHRTACDSSTITTFSSSTMNDESLFDLIVENKILSPVSIPELPTFSGRLREKLLGDVAVASIITLGVAPFVTIIDKAIVQRAAGSHTIMRSSIESISTMARNPIKFVKSPMFLMMWGVYAATYSAANSLKTIVEHIEEQKNDDPAEEKDNKMGKTVIFAGTTLVNSTTTLLKDQAYARMFGTVGAATKVPMISYGLWASRDCMVIGSSFILPEIVSKSLEEQGFERTKALSTSQIVCPVVTQVVAGPVQLLGLDFYNRPMNDLSYSQAAQQRLQLLGNKFFSIFAARVARIAPAYGVGGVGNTYLRDQWRARVEEKYQL